MVRRSRRGIPISLFSFQDIITAVTGVLILLTLLLTLQLIDAKELDGTYDSASLAEELKSVIADAESRRDSLKSQLQRTNETLRDAGETSPQILSAEIAELNAKRENLSREIASEKLEQKQMERRLRDAEAESFEAERDRKKLGQLRRATSELKQEVESLQTQDRVFYAFPRGDVRDGWLVEVAGKYVAVAQFGRTAPPRYFRGFRARRARSFMRWVEELNGGNEYFLFVIRPSGVEVFDLLEERIRTSGRAYGFDLIDERKILLDSEKGAAS